MSQIRWLSELALFDCNIQYPSGKNNKAPDALSQYPCNNNLPSEGDTNSDDMDTTLYATICDMFKTNLEDTRIPTYIRLGVQIMSNISVGRKQ